MIIGLRGNLDYLVVVLHAVLIPGIPNFQETLL